MKKTLAIILVVAMIVSIIPMSVSAAAGDIVMPKSISILDGTTYDKVIEAKVTVTYAGASDSKTVYIPTGTDTLPADITWSGLPIAENDLVTVTISALGQTITANHTANANDVATGLLILIGDFSGQKIKVPVNYSTASSFSFTVKDSEVFSKPISGAKVTATDAAGTPYELTAGANGVVTFPNTFKVVAGGSYVFTVSADGFVTQNITKAVGSAFDTTVNLAKAAAPTPTPEVPEVKPDGGIVDNPSEKYKVTTGTYGSGTITRSASYAPGTKVPVVAQADLGAQITDLKIWKDGKEVYDYLKDGYYTTTSTDFTVVKSASDKMVITIDAIDGDYEIVARFSQSYLPVVVRTNGGGTAKIISGSNLHGKTVTIEATPAAGYEFAGWEAESYKHGRMWIAEETTAKFSWKIDFNYYGQMIFTANFVRTSAGQAASDADGIVPPNNGTPAAGSNNPKTGDTNVIVWALVGIVALGAVAFAAKKATSR